ncbi:MAG: hypothetical protein M3P51_00975, partial [Chloroflexota bacterium]|nr:hypothetical protein [Chloroflexota bacterium]
MKKYVSLSLTLAALAGGLLPAGMAAQEKRPLTALDLYHLRVASDVALSPEGRRVVYVVTQADSAENRYKRDLWVAGTDGSGARRLTWTESASLGSPAFSPDGRLLAFTSAREGGRPQVWILPLTEGGEAWPLTDLKTGAVRPVWSPRGDRIAFTSALSPEELAAEDTAARPKKQDAKVDAAAMRNIHRDREAGVAAIRAKLAENARGRDPRVVSRLNYMGETALQEERWGQLYVVEARPGVRPRRLTSGSFGSG